MGHVMIERTFKYLVTTGKIERKRQMSAQNYKPRLSSKLSRTEPSITV